MIGLAKLLHRYCADTGKGFGGSAQTAGHDAAGLDRRAFAAFLATAALLPWIGRGIGRASADPLRDSLPSPGLVPEKKYPLFDEATASAVPPAGYQSRIALQDSIIRLIRNGVIDPAKFRALQQPFGTEQDGLADVFGKPSDAPIFLTSGNAADFVNLLWPVGLANHMEGNRESRLFSPTLPTFASTAGWTLGRQEQGSVYFNRFPIVDLTPPQEALAIRVATATFRPCCNNSTFFQDCNHGSALLGVLQLGASQGLQEEDLYREALAFNSFWFSDYYIRTALYFKVVRKVEWRDVDPKVVMSSEFSALGPWQQNVQALLETIPNLIPEPGGGANCGLSSSYLVR
ncbi:hypothetical protein AU467_25960 [Mesorhizobium loti]|uniref:Uncharacterized protein n=1 Tax=Rhizobium loti TaxID=381 RepID=A0A124GG47_RHILI|nr:hypothetical protein AU467_25960 [Mesorhizobium loti]